MVWLVQAIFTKLCFVQQSVGLVFKLQTFSTENPSFATSVVSTGALAQAIHPVLGMEKLTQAYEAVV